ncbi:hypothetical protein NWE55_01290 [Myroides albus]|uniref:Uncharacterized protein n=1 Tax=Myroides albus TaxID=2562892 RepID=A0A6I3LLM6_9FLAO|nr:hypothetical protein [Myroides albus]MTG98587.1 hypothetical protein [Myroides albus]UVD79954.1 hypothetical protein NWE55_01290 [Myroides albus]
MKNKYYIPFLLLCFVLYSYTSFSQIVIGEKVLPKQGTLLQIQNLPDQPNDLTNSNKGLLLPRVSLTDINNLYPMFATGYNKSVLDPIHIGLLVFNVNENLVNGKGIGIYVWDGSKWTNLDLNL